MITTKKISLNKFQEKSAAVLKLVNTKNMAIVVYDNNGPVARLAPLVTRETSRKLRAIEPRRKRPSAAMDEGGIWKIPGAIRKPANGSSWWTHQWSLTGMLRAAKASAMLSFITKF